MSKDDLWVLEWHHRSNGIHVQQLSKTIGVNLTKFHLDHHPAGWVPICVGTRAEVFAQADNLRQKLIEREAAKQEQDAV